jgi:glycosyltransferase involved in cell wall biosynthesis
MAEAQWLEHQAPTPADVCIIVEGAYPYVPGGVSAWIDWLIRTQPDLTFCVVALLPKPSAQRARYLRPDNVIGFQNVYLQDFGGRPIKRMRVPDGLDELADALSGLTTVGGRDALADVTRRLDRLRGTISLPAMYNSPVAWRLVERMYAIEMPFASFLHYFWGWRALLGGLFAVLECPLPRARIYHTISTGYAGILAARAALETGRPAILTEHGIYTNERRIELLMADWVADTVDKGHAIDDPRFDLRDMWVRAFEAYARTCYQASTEVVTLYRDNQRAQRVLGADERRLKVIANGIDLKRFAHLVPPPDTAIPSIALIGRVVPIKDVKTYIRAVGHLATRFASLKAYVVGPTDEDEAYADECRALVRDLRLEQVVEFTGAVDIVQYLPKVHIVVLTSLSESQPLVVLEAGASGLPFVATNVGSCREILEGRPDEVPQLGRGGIVTDVVDDRAIADAVELLLRDHPLRHAYGATLKKRVETTYRSDQAVAAYTALYAPYLSEEVWVVNATDRDSRRAVLPAAGE